MRPFIPGMALNQEFFLGAVEPLLRTHFPGLAYTAGLIDYGSDVLGFDDPVSTDHQWGPRLSLFLSENDLRTLGPEIDQVLTLGLPREFRGYPTGFSGSRADFIRHMEASAEPGVKHLIRLHSPQEFFGQHLGVAFGVEPTLRDWLTFPQQRLATVRRGRLFHDDLGVGAFRRQLHYYPDEVWYHLMAVEWGKIASEEAFVGRCGAVGDDLGSRLAAARQVHRAMNLAFFQDREYAPYAKWFGTAFRGLTGAAALEPALEGALAATDWRIREEDLCAAYRTLADRHNLLFPGSWVDPAIRTYYDREYRVIFADRFAQALGSLVTSEDLRTRVGLGNVDQLSDAPAVLESTEAARRFTLLS